MPKVHIFEDEREAYDMSQCREEIKDGDVLLIPGACAAVLYEAWPIIAAGTDRCDGQVMHRFMDGFGWDSAGYDGYMPSVHLARYAFLSHPYVP